LDNNEVTISSQTVAVFCISEQHDLYSLSLSFRGVPDQATGMVINLSVVEYWLKQIKILTESRGFDTLKKLFETIQDYLIGQAKGYSCQIESIEIGQPFTQVYFKYKQDKIFVTLVKNMRYQNQFGLAKVGFDYESYNKIPDRERRQDVWMLSMAENAALALKGRFPLALFCEFKDLVTGQLIRFER